MARHSKWHHDAPPRHRLFFHLRHHREAGARGRARCGWHGGCHALSHHRRRHVSGRFKNESLLETIDGASAVAFGSPTYMGGPAAQFKAFADASSDRWSKQAWANKIAAGFTTGACAGGDQLHTLSYFSILAAQHGMLWCGLDIPGGEDPSGRNRLGSQLGLATHLIDGSLPQSDLGTAEYLGQRLSRMASRNG
nr:MULTISPECIES: flavodoxin family protein [unclassified Bradyrhizobium]